MKFHEYDENLDPPCMCEECCKWRCIGLEVGEELIITNNVE